MKVAITGASGFVGKNLIKYLQKSDIQTIKISLRNPEWVTLLPFNSDALIHLAGKAHDTSNVSESTEYFKVNRDLTIKLFNQFLNSDIKDFLYFSSVKAVADSVDGILTEDYEPNPTTAYGQSKHEAERYLLKQNLPEGKRLFIIRPCMIHGPHNKGNLNLLFNLIKRGLPWPLASFDNQRSFLSISNLNYLVKMMILNRQLKSGVFNFADDESISTNQLISLIDTVATKNTKMLWLPKGIVQCMARIGDVLPFPINSERLKKLTETYVVSNEKIKCALAINRLPISAEDGLKETIASFHVNG
ncbi:NAD-dependent epimerase/dehydratase family protein [Sphingobacterium sp. JB170]|uniref:NAD-dependent epimerase/dehydratase family protein n=1 Tax=Sphingobacterium sp. JB170 TaxID=1434842 RepID=UPI00097F111F|nr:NAD-dependent epimerase/dehydratase family protein [Sphingobacterium sp. JB170]SJN28805.1 UDP-glucose 4-epimerase [Sphingobacterium sp. JB170]